MQTELQNTKTIVRTIKDEKDSLEDQIKALKGKVDKLTIVHPSLSLAYELGSLSVKELELKNAQEELEEAKQSLLNKDKLLAESSTENENLRRQVEARRQALNQVSIMGQYFEGSEEAKGPPYHVAR